MRNRSENLCQSISEKYFYLRKKTSCWDFLKLNFKNNFLEKLLKLFHSLELWCFHSCWCTLRIEVSLRSEQRMFHKRKSVLWLSFGSFSKVFNLVLISLVLLDKKKNKVKLMITISLKSLINLIFKKLWDYLLSSRCSS